MGLLVLCSAQSAQLYMVTLLELAQNTGTYGFCNVSSLLSTSSAWPEVHSPQHDIPNLEMIGLFVTPFWASIDLEFGETELRGGPVCERGCVVGSLVRVCGAGLLPPESCWDSWPRAGVRDLLMDLGAPEGKGQNRLPGVGDAYGEEAREFLPGLTAASPCWPLTHRVFLAPLPSSLPLSCSKLTHPCPSRSCSLISEITGKADLPI